MALRIELQRVRFPTETLRSRMLYAEDVGGPGTTPPWVGLSTEHKGDILSLGFGLVTFLGIGLVQV
jgi:hypothetical protein